MHGAVQGVGFRPFIFRLATELHLNGWVSNSAQGVLIEVEGATSTLEGFLLRVESERPPRSFIQSLEASWLDAVGCRGFEIRPSESGGQKTALVLPDIATCPDCVREIFDPANRRHFYPFTNCTNCGPRFSIIQALPYDRANTSMRPFTMCPACQAEYEDPRDRRFHAQPNACSVCGPHLSLWDKDGKNQGETQPQAQAVLEKAATAIQAGKIVAVKGLGGFHLLAAAGDEAAVGRLRELKHREEKPFAVMFSGIEAVGRVCAISAFERRLLLSPEAPIVLLRRLPQTGNAASGVAAAVAPHNPWLGVMLAYTPLHHLLLRLVGAAVVATSGNAKDEPICTDEQEALDRLGGIADLFLVHNRPIVRHVDDSVVRIIAGREMVLRRARGFAPLPFKLAAIEGRAESILGVGAHLKNAIALSAGDHVFVSQHIGDLETEPAFAAFQQVVADFEKLFEIQPATIAADAHPDYLSTKFAEKRAAAPSGTTSAEGRDSGQVPPKLYRVQHHLAHALACMAENELQPPLLGVSWDGTGYGLDGTVWGGEFFRLEPEICERAAHLRLFPLPGGEAAVRQPRRTALGLLYAALGEAAFERGDLPPVRAFSAKELRSLKTMLARRINSPLTSSVGRLFDGVASLIGLRQQVRYEGQAAMELEFALHEVQTDEAYPLPCTAPVLAEPPSGQPGPAPALELDWSDLIQGVIEDLCGGVSPGVISARFHNGLVEAILAVARHFGQRRVLLSGGCFQNRYLTERAVRRLREEGFQPYWHQRVPPNDGGIALGQVVAARRQITLARALPPGS